MSKPAVKATERRRADAQATAQAARPAERDPHLGTVRKCSTEAEICLNLSFVRGIVVSRGRIGTAPVHISEVLLARPVLRG